MPNNTDTINQDETPTPADEKPEKKKGKKKTFDQYSSRRKLLEWAKGNAPEDFDPSSASDAGDAWLRKFYRGNPDLFAEGIPDWMPMGSGEGAQGNRLPKGGEMGQTLQSLKEQYGGRWYDFGKSEQRAGAQGAQGWFRAPRIDPMAEAVWHPRYGWQRWKDVKGGNYEGLTPQFGDPYEIFGRKPVGTSDPEMRAAARAGGQPTQPAVPQQAPYTPPPNVGPGGENPYATEDYSDRPYYNTPGGQQQGQYNPYTYALNEQQQQYQPYQSYYKPPTNPYGGY